MPREKKLGIIDYGAGNFSSVVNAIRHIGLDFQAIGTAAELESVTHIILPGVGAFAHTMEKLDRRGFTAEIRRQACELRKPFLGVCVGMQVLASVGNEHESVAGLDILAGSVDRIPDPENRLRIPHIGWTEVNRPHDSPLFRGIDPDGSFYFVHSYVFNAQNAGDVAATCSYGGTLTAAVARGNIFGVQFHPEKSQANGLRLLKNFFEHTEWN